MRTRSLSVVADCSEVPYPDHTLLDPGLPALRGSAIQSPFACITEFASQYRNRKGRYLINFYVLCLQQRLGVWRKGKTSSLPGRVATDDENADLLPRRTDSYRDQ